MLWNVSAEIPDAEISSDSGRWEVQLVLLQAADIMAAHPLGSLTPFSKASFRAVFNL